MDSQANELPPAEPPVPKSEQATATEPVNSPELSDWDEDLYQATSSMLIEPALASNPWVNLGCLVGSLVLFVLSFVFAMGMETLALLIPVLFFHEAGHFLGMQMFGYRNIQMFFIPFFGAAVAGKKHAAPVWQQAVVLLLGPMPGLLLGLVLQLVLKPHPNSWQANLVIWLVLLNGFNLLPIVPLDGGRLVDLLLFARRPVLTVVFRLTTVVALGVFAWLEGSIILIGLAVVLLLGAQGRYRQAQIERLFRDNPHNFPPRLEDLSDQQRRELFGWALLLHPLARTPVSLAGEIRTLHEQMVSERPSTLAWWLLILVYLSGFGLVVTTTVIAREHNQEVGKAEYLQRKNELVMLWDEALKEIVPLRKKQVETKNLGAKKQIQKEVDARWWQLMEKWKHYPAEVRMAAWLELFLKDDPNNPRHREDVRRLKEEMNSSNSR